MVVRCCCLFVRCMFLFEEKYVVLDYVIHTRFSKGCDVLLVFVRFQFLHGRWLEFSRMHGITLRIQHMR